MGIAEGTKYTVTEKPTEHYIQTLPVDQEGYVNKVVRPSVESLPFVNEYEENLLSLEILKKNSVSDPEKLEYLAGAEFELYSDEECTTFAALNSEGETAFTTGEDGRLVIADLSDGIYFLKETKAPDGYIAAKDPIKIVLSKYSDCIVDGQFAEIHMENDTPDTLEDDNTLSVDVINRKVYQIPITGGLGMNMLYLISGCLVLGGIALYLVYRKKHA